MWRISVLHSKYSSSALVKTLEKIISGSKIILEGLSQDGIQAFSFSDDPMSTEEVTSKMAFTMRYEPPTRKI